MSVIRRLALVWLCLALAACDAPAAALPAGPAHPTGSASPTPAPSLDWNSQPQVLDLSFADPLHGWALAAGSCAGEACSVIVYATEDGGRSWTRRSTPAASAAFFFPADPGADGPAVRRLLFANAKDGWLYGPRPFETHDGGSSWKPVALTGDTVSMAAAPDGSLWALTRDCTPAQIDMGDCITNLRASSIRGGAWRPLGLPWIRGSVTTLLRWDARTAWIMAAVKLGTTAYLYATRDAGATWRVAALPCSAAGSADGIVSPLVAAASASALTDVCQAEPGAGTADKTVYASADGGWTWSKAARSNAAAGLPVAGYAADLAYVAPSTTWLALIRGRLATSSDRGATWSTARGTPQAESIVRIVFTDQNHGWAAATSVVMPDGTTVRSAVLRTHDGGASWSAVELSG